MVRPTCTILLNLLLCILLSACSSAVDAVDSTGAEDVIPANVCPNNDELVAKLRAELSETKKLLRNTHMQLRTFLKNESYFQIPYGRPVVDSCWDCWGLCLGKNYRQQIKNVKHVMAPFGYKAAGVLSKMKKRMKLAIKSVGEAIDESPAWNFIVGKCHYVAYFGHKRWKKFILSFN